MNYLADIPTDVVRLVTDLSKTLYLVVQEDGEYQDYECNVRGIYTDFNVALKTMLEYYGYIDKKNVYNSATKKWTYHCLMDDFTEYRCHIREIRLDQEQTESPFIYAFSEVQDGGKKMKFLRYRHFEGRLPYCYEEGFRTVLSEPLPKVYKTLIKRKEHRGEKKIAEIDVDFVPPNLEQLDAWNWEDFEKQRLINNPIYHERMSKEEEEDHQFARKYRAGHPESDEE